MVFEAGGVKGIALAGAVATLEERGFAPEYLAGASAGAIVAALLGAGYTGAELKEIIMNMPFKKFRDTDWEDRVPIVGSHVAPREGREYLPRSGTSQPDRGSPAPLEGERDRVGH
ncbi:MAG: patatin-like phospholipase family protein [Armatimonadetes bacterium]|nr:patatin-like phospholipase family protein [Armatimonadota bacterium]